MAGIQNNNSTGTASFGHIDELPLLPGLILDLSDRRGAGIAHGENTADYYGITKADVNESVVHLFSISLFTGNRSPGCYALGGITSTL